MVTAKYAAEYDDEDKNTAVSTSAAVFIPSAEIAAASLSQLSISEPTKAKPQLCPAVPSSSKWTLWRYNCRDFPEHICFIKPCPFCDQMNKLKGVTKGAIVIESTDRWDNYLKKEKSYDDEQTLMKVLDEFLPSKLVKNVFFNRKLGVAIFRGDIAPKGESAENIDGIVFQLLLIASSGRKSAVLVTKFDAIFLQMLRLTFELPAEIARHINGILLRCLVNPGKSLNMEANPYANHMDLPFIIKLEVWLRNQSNKDLIWDNLIKEVQKKIEELKIPQNAFRPFIISNRMKLSENEAQNQPVESGRRVSSAGGARAGSGILVFSADGKARELDEDEENEWAGGIFNHPLSAPPIRRSATERWPGGTKQRL